VHCAKFAHRLDFGSVSNQLFQTIMTNPRKPDHPVNPMFINRWSPRSLTGETMSHETLMTVLEAARWAPSAYNAQPWRFIYALKDDAGWAGIFGAVNEGNQSWAHRAGALVVVASAKQALFPGKTELTANAWHSFDTGSAWMSMALQAAQSGLVAHALAGFDPVKLRAAIHLPDDYALEAVIVLGKQGDKAQLPEALQQREAPNARKPLSEISFAGTFKA
jgi:nitroreductase